VDINVEAELEIQLAMAELARMSGRATTRW